MESQDIHSTINNFFKTLEKSAPKSAATFDKESIHQFRVTYKKLRAFLRMLESDICFDGKIKIPRRIKTAYAAAGQIRDLQLHQERMRGPVRKNKPGHIAFKLIRDAEEKRKCFTKAYNLLNFTKLKKRIIASTPTRYSPASFPIFINNKWQAANAIINKGDFSDSNMHFIRKSLKDLFYNLRLFKGKEYRAFYKLACKNKSIGYFENLLKQLGNFQDKCVEINLSKKYSKKAQSKQLAELNTATQNSKRQIIDSLKGISMD